MYYGIQEGVTGLFLDTYTLKRQKGAKGVAEGLSKGVANVVTKTGAGVLGLVAYPCAGVYKSIHTALHSRVGTQISRAKLEETTWFDQGEDESSWQTRSVIQIFVRKSNDLV